MKKPYFFPIVIILLICTGLGHQEQPLSNLLPEDDMIFCAANGYYNSMETDVDCAIPQENIAALIDATTVKKGKASNALPSPCIEIRATYESAVYVIDVGADSSISVASTSELDARTFWVDTSGQLFNSLYNIHLENGGAEFP